MFKSILGTLKDIIGRADDPNENTLQIVYNLIYTNYTLFSCFPGGILIHILCVWLKVYEPELLVVWGKKSKYKKK
jgi:hypothetical protein